MHRFTGGTLPSGSSIALIANDALGNFAISGPVAQALKSKHKGSRVHGFTGTRVMEIAQECAWLDQVFPVYGESPRVVARRLLDLPEYDYVVNIENATWAKSLAALLAGEQGAVTGPCANADGRGDLPFENSPEGRLWADKEWIRDGLRIDYPFLSTGHISEIVVRCCYCDGPIPPYRLPRHDPNRTIPDVLISTAASLPEKLWSIDKWIELVGLMEESGRSVGLLGAKSKDQNRFWVGGSDEDRLVDEAGVEDLRGELTLPQVVGALDQASLVVTLDNGILHFACATQTPVVGLFRHGIHRLWAPPVANLKILEPGASGVVNGLSVDRVWRAINNFQIILA